MSNSTPARTGSIIPKADAEFLQASEGQVISLMVENGLWEGPVPSLPASGELEWGLVPYWIHNPPAFLQDFLQTDSIAADIWEELEAQVPTRIDKANYDALLHGVEAEGLVEADGGIIGTATYELLDPGWVWALINYIVTYDDRAGFKSDPPPAPIALTNSSSTDPIVIAVVGDWGTGSFKNGTALEVMSQITSLKPDYIIHLGDVYYAGTGGLLIPLNEEKDHFVELWPQTGVNNLQGSFALNSNHEMYSGAKGYFDTALTDPRFELQQGYSYFALQVHGWTLLGLDSAYYATGKLFMDGSLGGSTHTEQADWIRGLDVDPAKAIVFTHHNGLSTDGTQQTGLWTEVSAALGNDPAAWYWGHIHNGIVYSAAAAPRTFARCVGHGAIPFGNAWGLAPFTGGGSSPQTIDYYAHTPAETPRVKNGFALLTFTLDGQVREELYEVDNTKEVYSNTYTKARDRQTS